MGFLWCFKRVFLQGPSGRKRYNVLGALNAANNDIITIANEDYINADSICELIKKVRDCHKDGKITFILDNARYQKCQKVFECAEKFNIELLYLPSYSPNLNIIERFWKFIKRKCLYGKYYETFQTFKEVILETIVQANYKNKKQLQTLLTHNFQSFKS